MYRVLVVEDDPNDMELFRHAVSGIPMEMVECSKGVVGMTIFKSGIFHAVFVNLKLPDMDGIELVRWFRGQSRELHIVVITGADSADVKTMATEAGATGFFHKPYTHEDNLMLVSQLIATKTAYKRGLKNMKSWKTTSAGVAGLITLIASTLTQLTDGNPATNPDWNIVVPMAFTSLIGIFARDNGVSSEQVGAVKPTVTVTTPTP